MLFEAFGERLSLRPAKTKPGERPYLIARIALNRGVLLEAAAAGCVKSGSGGAIRQFPQTTPPPPCGMIPSAPGTTVAVPT